MDRPSKRISPRVGRYTAVMQLIKVVLPAPFGPMNPTISPSGSSRFTPVNASSPPKDFDRLLISRMGSHFSLTEVLGEFSLQTPVIGLRSQTYPPKDRRTTALYTQSISVEKS